MDKGIHASTRCSAPGLPESGRKERPILFSGAMVQAILSGRKTQTRRVVRKQFAVDAEPAEVSATSPEGWQISGHSGLWWDDCGACIDDAIRCPFGMPGDRLWVRETWQCIRQAKNGQRSTEGPPLPPIEGFRWTEYAASPSDEPPPRWRPSIHMPRWASRITLEVTGVRVERLNDISEKDAIAEGIAYDDSVPFNGPWFASQEDSQGYGWPKDAYQALWEHINGDGSWAANPWVWVVEFRVIP